MRTTAISYLITYLTAVQLIFASTLQKSGQIMLHYYEVNPYQYIIKTNNTYCKSSLPCLPYKSDILSVIIVFTHMYCIGTTLKHFGIA